MENKMEGPLRLAVENVQKLLERSQRTENKVLERYGICGKYQEIVGITKLVNELCNWLQDALCYLLLDINCVREAFLTQQLMYQNA